MDKLSHAPRSVRARDRQHASIVFESVSVYAQTKVLLAEAGSLSVVDHAAFEIS